MKNFVLWVLLIGGILAFVSGMLLALRRHLDQGRKELGGTSVPESMGQLSVTWRELTVALQGTTALILIVFLIVRMCVSYCRVY